MNIVYMFADQLRRMSLGYAGDPLARTPNIDSLARESCELTEAMSGITLGTVPADLHEKLAPILSNDNIFGSDLYKAGIGETIEGLFAEELTGPGAVRATLVKYLG